ncbi:hypothetical protein JXB11_04715 [Candidatus Woesearchaeota archaeon]|nr:hypothetical protein [Candidatus Woesearchaeota archaeon]
MGIQEGIKVVHVSITRLGVSSFSLQDETITLEIGFNDGTQKQVYRTTRLEETDELASKILEDIVKMEENINMEFDGEQLTGTVHVIMERYDEVYNSLVNFLKDVHCKLCKIKNAKISDGYIDMVRALQHTGLRFYG